MLSGLLEARDLRSTQRRQRLAHPLSPGLGIDLTLDLDHFAVESADHIGIAVGRMIMITRSIVIVTVALVQTLRSRSVRFLQTEDGISVERVGERLALACLLFEMERDNVVMIVIRPTAVTAPLVELADLLRDLASIILRIENGNAVHSDGDGPTQETPLDHRGFGGWNGFQGQAPRVRTDISLWQRHLLLPVGDADHHGVIRHAIPLDVKVILVP